jgi:hypothetical protein
MEQSLETPSQYSLTYYFTARDDADDTEHHVTLITDTNDTRSYTAEAFDQLAADLGLPSGTDAETTWKTNRVGVKFENAPWNTQDELEQTLCEIEGVKTARYDPPHVEDWHPSRYFLTVKLGTASRVCDDVRQYYGGLKPELVREDVVKVCISPLC